MKQFTLFSIIVLLVLLSCEQRYSRKSFTIEGEIEGFTKGTIYLKKKQDTLFIAVDSFLVQDNGKFFLTDDLSSPEIYYLKIKEIPKDSLLVFGEEGILHLTSNIDKLVTHVSITGGNNHELLTEYKQMIAQFQDKQLDLFKANFDAEKAQDSVALDSLNRLYKNHIKRRYLYTTNFAVKHADQEVAPYIALTALYNANISLLDTVNNSLSERVKASKYGKQLDQFIRVIKKNEGVE